MNQECRIILTRDITVNNQEYSEVQDFTGDCLSMLGYQLERYCKKNHLVILSKERLDKFTSQWTVRNYKKG